MKHNKKQRIGLISSRGGHLYQMMRLKGLWKNTDHFWVTEKGRDSESLLKKERVYYGYFPVTHNALNALSNFFFAISLFCKIRPTVLMSCGSGIAPPMFLAGKLLGCTLIFIDSYTFCTYPSLSARIISYFADITLTQHKNISQKYPRLSYWGSLL